jgi:hypothetical protein
VREGSRQYVQGDRHANGYPPPGRSVQEQGGRHPSGVQGSGNEFRREQPDERKRRREEQGPGRDHPAPAQHSGQVPQRRRTEEPAKKHNDCYDFPGL